MNSFIGARAFHKINKGAVTNRGQSCFEPWSISPGNKIETGAFIQNNTVCKMHMLHYGYGWTLILLQPQAHCQYLQFSCADHQEANKSSSCSSSESSSESSSCDEQIYEVYIILVTTYIPYSYIYSYIANWLFLELRKYCVFLKMR